jgi:hypothetical protein
MGLPSLKERFQFYVDVKYAFKNAIPYQKKNSFGTTKTPYRKNLPVF